MPRWHKAAAVSQKVENNKKVKRRFISKRRFFGWLLKRDDGIPLPPSGPPDD